MADTRNIFIVFDQKLSREVFEQQLLGLNLVNDDFTFSVENNIIQAGYDSTFYQEEVLLGFGKILIKEIGYTVEVGISYYATESHFVDLETLKSDDFVIVAKYQDKLLSLLKAKLKNCLFAGHDNFTGLDIDYIYEAFSKGESLQRLGIHVVQ
ncbi:hypothetical protein BKI52_07260 [marine bacterium AO1-C]|nr:hypothetical protein BKI52_07260 [marine bacterium AO1-C]